MKDFIEITLIWITHIFWLLVVFLITSIGLGVLKEIGLNYENSVCTIYGYVIGMICTRVIHRGVK